MNGSMNFGHVIIFVCLHAAISQTFWDGKRDVSVCEENYYKNIYINDISTVSSRTKILYANLTSRNVELLKDSGILSRFKQLEHLSISCKSPNRVCETLRIEDGCLEHVKTSLKVLKLSHNTNVNFTDNIFCRFPYLVRIDLSFNNLRDIQHLGFGDVCGKPSILEESRLYLCLHNNKIAELPRGVFSQLKRLSVLVLSNNEIRTIHAGAFRGLIRVDFIDLKRNRLKTLNERMFHYQRELKTLNLQFNQLASLSSLANLETLERLNLNGNRLSILPEFLNMTWVSRLELQNNAIENITHFSTYQLIDLRNMDLSKNRITSIRNNDFSTMVELETLRLSHNKIRNIEPGAFRRNKKLSYVYVDNNQIVTLDNLLESIPIRIIDASKNNIREFVYIARVTELRHLNFSHNEIETFNCYAVNWTSTSNGKTVVDLSFNKLVDANALVFPSSVNEMWLNNNSFQSFDSENFLVLTSLEALYLHNNFLETFCDVDDKDATGWSNRNRVFVTLRGNPLICSRETEWIRARRNFPIVVNDADNVTCKSHYPKGSVSLLKNWNYFLSDSKCECLMTVSLSVGGDLTNFDCQIQCLDNCLCYSDSGETFMFVDCSSKNLSGVPNGIVHVKTVHLSLDGNVISSINGSDFRFASNIEQLYLNNSNLEDFHQKTFENFTALTVLHMEDNLLETIPEKAFSYLENLQELYLSRNRLFSLKLSTEMRKLSILELNDNLLTNYPVWELVNFARLETIAVQNNPWSCECDQVEPFQTWLIRASNVVDKVNISCVDQSKIERLIYETFEECTDLHVSLAPIWSSVAAIAVAIVISSILVYFYRREVQVLIYSRYGFRIFNSNNDDMDRNKLCDVFISYSSKDEEFLVQDFLPNLEGIEHPYRVCLHARDFLAGGYISDNIATAIDNCRRTIVLLSENFVLSEWCKYEFRLAHLKMIEDKCNRLVIVVVDKVPEDIGPELRDYLLTNTYLTWGERLFWKKLYFALSRIRSSPDETSMQTTC